MIDPVKGGISAGLIGVTALTTGEGCKYMLSFSDALSSLFNPIRKECEETIQTMNAMAQSTATSPSQGFTANVIKNQTQSLASTTKTTCSVWIHLINEGEDVIRIMNSTGGKSAVVAGSGGTALIFLDSITSKKPKPLELDILRGALLVGLPVGLAIGNLGGPSSNKGLQTLASVGIGLMSGGIGGAVGNVAGSIFKAFRSLQDDKKIQIGTGVVITLACPLVGISYMKSIFAGSVTSCALSYFQKMWQGTSAEGS